MTTHPNPAGLPSLTTTLSPSRQRLRSNGVSGKFIPEAANLLKTFREVHNRSSWAHKPKAFTCSSVS